MVQHFGRLAGPFCVSGTLMLCLAAVPLAAAQERASTKDEHSPDGLPAVLTPPANLKAGPFEALVEQMWRASPTFRRQCERLRAAARFTVLLRAHPPRTGSAVRALTTFTGEATVGTARIDILSPVDAIELIAHEIEHVIEHLDGAVRGHDSCAGRLQSGSPGPRETCRAIEAGRRVAREVEDDRRWSRQTLRQRDTVSGPLDAASADVSADGRFVAFTSAARLLPGARDAGTRNLYLHDLTTGELRLVSASPGPLETFIDFRHPRISGDGQVLVFDARARKPIDDVSFGWSVVTLDRQTQSVLAVQVGDGAVMRRRNSTPVISSDGSTIAFESIPLRSSDSRPGSAIYVRRLRSGLVERVDVPDPSAMRARDAILAPHATQRMEWKSMGPAVSADGRHVAFASTGNLTCERRGPCGHSRPPRELTRVFVRDTATGTTTLVSRGIAGGEPNGHSYRPAISADGRYVAFTSEASNLVKGDRNGSPDIFVHDMLTGKTELVSRRPDGRSGTGSSVSPVLSGDGSKVAFQSLAPDLICLTRCPPQERDINLLWDVFLFDRHAGTMERISAEPDREWMGASRSPSIDHAGRVLAFSSRHPIDAGDDAADDDLYIQIRDR